MNNNITSLGLAIIRVGLGVMMMLHGFPKLFGGTEVWNNLGSTMGMFGIDNYHTFFGLLAAVSEFVGGLFLILGFLTRPFAILLAITMLVATAKHYFDADGTEVFRAVAHPFELFWVFVGLAIIGPGKVSLSNILNNRDSYYNDGDDFEEY